MEWDEFMQKHQEILYHKLFDASLKKLIRPYEAVYVKYIARELNISEQRCAEKLEKLIIEGVIDGGMDSKDGVLRVNRPKKRTVDFLKTESLLNELDRVAV